jgi:hypothetical protein
MLVAGAGERRKQRSKRDRQMAGFFEGLRKQIARRRCSRKRFAFSIVPIQRSSYGSVVQKLEVWWDETKTSSQSRKFACDRGNRRRLGC